MNVQPYLFFEGRCEEALEFYQRAIGAKVTFMMRNHESPEPHAPGALPAGAERKVLHAAFQVGDTTILASDGMCSGAPSFQGVSLALEVENAAAAERRFAALADGGTVRQPLITTFFSSKFGVVSDRFGVSWMIVVEQAA
jgi:PhnB protein